MRFQSDWRNRVGNGRATPSVKLTLIGVHPTILSFTAGQPNSPPSRSSNAMNPGRPLPSTANVSSSGLTSAAVSPPPLYLFPLCASHRLLHLCAENSRTPWPSSPRAQLSCCELSAVSCEPQARVARGRNVAVARPKLRCVKLKAAAARTARLPERGTSGSVQRGPANPARPGREQRYRDCLGCRRSPEVPRIEKKFTAGSAVFGRLRSASRVRSAR